MGTICVPAYANIFMAELEQKYIYLLIKDKSTLFLLTTLFPNLKNYRKIL